MRAQTERIQQGDRPASAAATQQLKEAKATREVDNRRPVTISQRKIQQAIRDKMQPSFCAINSQSSRQSIIQRVEEKEFLSSVYKKKDYVPDFGLGRFDMTIQPAEGIAEVVVRMHVNFSDEKMSTGLGPWTDDERLAWKQQANDSVKKVWNNVTEFTINNDGWEPIKIKPRFSVVFVDSMQEAHIETTAVKIPQPMEKQGIWDVGRNGLMQDQFEHGPMTPTRAFLSQIAPKFRQDTASEQLHHNIFAHEYGHMLGLSDEYDNETDINKTGPGKRQAGNEMLMNKYQVEKPEWGKHSHSLMSDGSELLSRHFLTVRDALEKIIVAQLPKASVAMEIHEGSPVWMELAKEKQSLFIAINSMTDARLGIVPTQLQDSLVRELDYEESVIKQANGNMSKIRKFLADLPATRLAYYNTFIRDRKQNLIDSSRSETSPTKFDKFIENFLLVKWSKVE